MSQDISLQSLIEKVKDELLAPTGGPGYPVFFVDKVELDLQVAVTYEKTAGLKIEVLQVGGVQAGGSMAHEQGQNVKVTLSPILSREEQRELLKADQRMWDGVQRATQSALRKTGDGGMAGEME